MMRWILRKENDECLIKVKKTDEEETDFSYIEMIKELYENKKLEPVEYEGEFSETEKESVNALINDINLHVQTFFECDDGINIAEPTSVIETEKTEG